MYERRLYRESLKTDDLVSFTVVVKETDLFILADRDMTRLALEVVINHRHQLESYISRHPDFLRSLVPVRLMSGAPESALRMSAAADAAGVGPMAAVAGTFAELVGEALLTESSQVIVENGGDIYLRTERSRIVALYAGDSPLSGKLGINIPGGQKPRGVCTSSGKVGPSFSFGVAHAACVISESAALADAAASAVGNAVIIEGQVEEALAVSSKIAGVMGAVVISGDKVGAWGSIELVGL